MYILDIFELVFSGSNSNVPFGLGALGGMSGLENLGLSGNFMEMQQRMQQALLSNPDAVRQVMDNPIVQQLMNDPNNVRQLLLSNPQMQDIIEVSVCLGLVSIDNYCWHVRIYVGHVSYYAHFHYSIILK